MPLGEFRRVLEHLTEAGEQARAAGDRRRLGLVSAFLTNYHNLMGDLDRAVESGRQALAIAAETADPQTEILANATLGLVHYVRGEYAEAMQAARANIRLLHGPRAFERFGSASLPSIYSRTCLAWSLAELGVFAEGAAVADEGLRIAEAARHSFSLVYAHLGVGILNLRKGELGLALEALERAFSLCHDADIPLLASVVALPLASAYRLTQRGEDALRMLDEAGRQAASIGDPVERRVGPGALAEAFLAVGRAADALPLARRYLEERRRLKARGFEAWALKLLGDVLSRQTPAETAEAQACYQQALSIATALGMRPLEGISRLALADLFELSGKRQDAKAELAAAEDSLRALGMSHWADQAAARLVAWR
jgi:tetratricopeptide (TPR) repeat protein